jgi:hypothetical protein
LIVSQDLSLNGRLFVSGNVSINGNLNVVGITNLGNIIAGNLITNESIEYNSTNAASNNVSPNSVNATSDTWKNNDIIWTASASTNYNLNSNPYYAFDTSYGSTNRWGSVQNSYNSQNGTYLGTVNTIVSDVSVSGEWIQLKSSIPLTMNNYTFSSGTNARQLPKVYTIAGSDDGTNWYTIQRGNIANVPGSNSSQMTPFINTAITGTTSYGNSNITTTTNGSYTTKSYYYFRLICQQTLAISSGITVEIGEWTINFKPYYKYKNVSFHFNLIGHDYRQHLSFYIFKNNCDDYYTRRYYETMLIYIFLNNNNYLLNDEKDCNFNFKRFYDLKFRSMFEFNDD